MGLQPVAQSAILGIRITLARRRKKGCVSMYDWYGKVKIKVPMFNNLSCKIYRKPPSAEPLCNFSREKSWYERLNVSNSAPVGLLNE